MMRSSSLIGIVVVLLSSLVSADVVTTVDGASFEGKVTSNDSFGVVVETSTGTLMLPANTVTSVRSAGPTTQPARRPGQRIPDWLTVVTELSAQPWAKEVRQIPATVIDKGVLRNVPYQSYRCGATNDYELNIYGDPDDPSCIELGVYRDLLKDPQAKQRCVALVAALMIQHTDAGIISAADLSKDLITRNGMTVEVTPETAEDAYGGWWVSVYFESALNQARASQEEMKALTVTAPPKPTTQAVAAADPQPTHIDFSSIPVRPVDARYAQPPYGSTSGAVAPQTDAWTPADMTYARDSAGGASSAGKTVYVRGYYRSNGTYVHSYTRSAPGSGHSAGHGGGGHR